MPERPVRVELAIGTQQVDLEVWIDQLVDAALRLERPNSSEEDAA
jgi:hypothetical protein